MKIFLSWSGGLSRDVATTLRTWLRGVIQAIDPWMSQEDLTPGSIWFSEISKKIKESEYGILCITRENQKAPWLLWEAGALYRGFEDTRRVVPLLIDVDKNALAPPLSHFQVIDINDRKEIVRMLTGINEEIGNPISKEILNTQVSHYWPALQKALAKSIQAFPFSPDSESTCEYNFRQAADKFLTIPGKMADSIKRDKIALRCPRTYIDKLPLDKVNNDALSQYKEDRLAGSTPPLANGKKLKAAKPGTINKEIRTVIAVLNRAVGDWGWLEYAQKIKQVARSGERRPYVLSWEQQELLFSNLPDYVKGPALFAVNTGVIKSIIRDLEWSWLRTIPKLEMPIFVVPPGYHGSKYGRTIFLNSISKQVIDHQRGKNEKYVFVAKQGGKFNFGKVWLTTWKKVGLPSGDGYAKGVDNLRRTFAHRLKVAKVAREDRELLLWVSTALQAQIDSPPNYEHLFACIEKITDRRDGHIVNL